MSRRLTVPEYQERVAELEQAVDVMRLKEALRIVGDWLAGPLADWIEFSGDIDAFPDPPDISALLAVPLTLTPREALLEAATALTSERTAEGQK